MKHRGSLAVDRMSEAALWNRLLSELLQLESDFPQGNNPATPAFTVKRALACARELRMRGTQTVLQIETARRKRPHYMEGQGGCS